MPQSTFQLRFGFARWLAHLRTGEAPGFAEIGRVVGRTGQAVSGWASAPEAPIDYRVHADLAKFLGVEEEWLIEEKGNAPKPELWAVWLHERSPDTATTRDTDARFAAQNGVKLVPKRQSATKQLAADAEKAHAKPAAKQAGGRKRK